MTEEEVMRMCRLWAAERGWHLWRNNVGVLIDKTGRPVRYGLANETKALNGVLKSGDLIGWDENGKFVSIECKRSRGGVIHPAQASWRDLVNLSGGRALIVSRREDLGT